MKIVNVFTLLISLLMLLGCDEKITDSETTMAPQFEKNQIVDDSIHVWEVWRETLTVLSDDSLIFSLSDTTVPFILSDSILITSSNLTDTGTYNFYIEVANQAGQADTLPITISIVPKYSSFKKILRESMSHPAGIIKCGQSWHDKASSSTSSTEYLYNEFGMPQKRIYSSSYYETWSHSLEYEYDSLYAPTVIKTINDLNIMYSIDSIFYTSDYTPKRVMSYEYYDDGSTYPTTIEFDTLGNVTQINSSYIMSVNGNQTLTNSIHIYTYNTQNQLVKYLRENTAVDSHDSTLYEYNDLGQMSKKVEYSSSWSYRTEYSYSNDGQLKASIQYDGNNNLSSKDEYHYNSANKLITLNNFCWNETDYNYTSGTDYDWQTINVITTPATASIIEEETGIYLRSDNSNDDQRFVHDAITHTLNDIGKSHLLSLIKVLGQKH